jgi:hypothetical protein
MGSFATDAPHDTEAPAADEVHATAQEVPSTGAPAAAATGRSLRLGGRSYPVILPKLRDPRLHVAAVVITIHTLGQVGLHFQVSVPQILSAVLTTAIIGVAITFRATRTIVWPASAMLTGSGVALILRVPTTPPGEHWTFHKWYVFAGVAALCMLIKHLIRYRGGPLFNPSNAGLVLAFLVLGSTRVEPLDFWWAPLNVWLIIAYIAIVGGGLLITRRLRLLSIAFTFWIALAIGLGLLANSGHSITARWAFTPVSGFDYWWVIMTSPELMIFVFFMITDPKTVPSGRVGRVLFGLMVAVTCVLLMAPQTTEFGTKIALLGGLVLVCAARPLIDRFVPAPGSEEDRLGRFAAAVTTGGRASMGLVGRLARVTLIAAALAVVGVGVVAAGTSAREVVGTDVDEVLGRVPLDVNPATFPTITVDQGVLDWDHEISGAGAQQIVLTLAENLELERQALLRDDEDVLKAVDHGDRLDDMRSRLLDARTSGTTVVQRYVIDDVHVTLLVPFGRQDGLSLGLESTGTVTEETYDASGDLQSSESKPFETMFVLRRATGGRWLNVAERPIGG